MKWLFFPLTLLILTDFSFAEHEKIRVAVNEFIAYDVDKSNVFKIAEQLRAELSNTDKFTAIEKLEMLVTLKNKGWKKPECHTVETSYSLGKLLNVSFVIFGTIAKFEEMRHTLLLRIIEVETGKVVLTINKDCVCPIDVILKTTIKEAVKEMANTEEIINAATKKKYSGLSVSTTPSGATVFLNEKKMGVTPYKNEKLSSGECNIRIEMDTYETKQKSILLNAGEIEELSFNLSRSQRYLDSLKTLDSLNAVKIEQKKADAEKEKKKKKIKLASRIALGTLTAGLVAGGIFMDSKAKDKMDEKEEIYNNYLSSNNFRDRDKYKEEYNKAHKDGEDLVKYRTIFYISAGVTTACFGVTFFF